MYKNKTSDWWREYRKTRRAKGICQKCNNTRRESSAFCERHLAKRRENAARKRARNVAAGKCSRCDKPLAPNSVLCADHVALNRAGNHKVSVAKARKRMIEIGIKDSFALLSEENEKRRLTVEQLRAQAVSIRKATGMCIVENCRWKSMPNAHTCLLHGPAMRGE